MSRHYAVLTRFLHGLCFLTIGVALTPDSSLLCASDRAVEFVWTATTGEGQTGSNTIEAENGDILTMTVYLSTEGDQGIVCYGVSVLFDIFANDEFDIVDVRGISDTLPPMGTTNPVGFIESSPTSTGVIQTINGGTLSGGVFNETFPIAEIDLVPVAIAPTARTSSPSIARASTAFASRIRSDSPRIAIGAWPPSTSSVRDSVAAMRTTTPWSRSPTSCSNSIISSAVARDLLASPRRTPTAMVPSTSRIRPTCCSIFSSAP